MRILVAHSFYRVPGGEDRHVRALVELLGQRHEVELLAERNDRLDPDLRTAKNMLYSLERNRRVENIVKRFRPHIIHLHNAYPALGPSVHLAAGKSKVPLVMTIHNFRLRCPNSYMFTEGSVCRRCESGVYAHALLHRCFPTAKQTVAYATILWMHRFLMRLERKISVFITPSQFMRSELLRWGFDGDRVIPIPNFTEAPKHVMSEPGGYGIYVGRLSSEKGLDTLLEALKLAGDPPFRIVGDGPIEGLLRERATALGLGNTTFVGRVAPERVEEELRSSRFFVMPSLCHENFPMAALEAMACGRPLLVTRRGGLPELVTDGEGLACEPADTRDMADKVGVFMQDDALCKRAGAQALKTATKEFAPGPHLARLEDAYEASLTEPYSLGRPHR